MLDSLNFLAQAMPDIPQQGWWLGLIILVLLCAAAFIDAISARVPDPIIFLGLFITTAVRGFLVSWPSAAHHLTLALIAGFSFYLVNLAWYRFKKRDALGMGDAKWTMLAVDGFGFGPVLIAWIVGSWLALGWIGIMRITKHSISRVYFAPFLFFGLTAGIYWLRFR